MKQIYNWQKATVFDIEGDGLLDDISMFHILSYKMNSGKAGSLLGSELGRWVNFFKYHIDNKIPVVAHYGIWFAVPAVEKLLDIDLSKLMVIDTVALSWYLNTKRKQHGLDSFFEDYGIKKVEVAEDQWAFKPSNQEEQEEHDRLMKSRCDDDVKINSALWEDLKNRLIEMYSLAKVQIDSGNVDGTRMSEDEVCYIDRYKKKSSVVEYIDRLLTFLMFKCDCARLQEKTRWEVDTDELYKLHDELEEIIVEAKKELESVMPEVPKYVKKTYPKKPTKKASNKKDCDKVVPSASGLAWNIHVDNIGKFDDLGNEISILVSDSELKVISKYDDPNANSSDQIKKFLFSHGWKPETFEFKKDEEAFKLWVATGFKKSMKPKDRAIPQINKEVDGVKELCPSVVRLIEKVPEIASYAKYTTVKNRLDVAKGHIRDLYKGKYLKAGIGGFTSTLRVQHRELVNLPAVNKMYGDRIRGYLIAGEGKVCLGSDLSSLEDRVKLSFMLPHDPDYVATMSEDNFDPHILMALTAGMVTQQEFDDFKLGIKSDNSKAGRSAGKTCLPIDTTEVLTESGWKIFDDILPSDRVLSLNTDSKETEFCNILGSVKYNNQEVTNMSTRSWELEATPDHRWFTEQRTGRYKSVRFYDCYRETRDLTGSSRVYSSMPYIGGTSSVTEVQARIIGWILADGSLWVSKLTNKTSQSKGKKLGFKCSISQSESKFLDEIREDLHKCGLRFGTQLNNSGVHVLTIKQGDIREFWRGVGLPDRGKHDIDYTQWMLSLSKEALWGFFDAFHKADGLTSERSKQFKTKTIYQNQGNICDAIQLCSELLGYNTYKNIKKCGRATMSCRASGMLGMQKVKREYSRNCDVFCLTTDNGNFIMRQGSFITITGNCNYASAYAAGAETIARGAGVDLKTGKKLHKSYWDLNWSIKAIAEDQCVITCSQGLKWLVNPINGFCYSLRKEKDRFSALCQGTGSFIFDMWLDNILSSQQRIAGKKSLTGSFHDEYICVFKDSPKNRKLMEKITMDAIQKVNEDYLLRRPMDCDVQFGNNYSEIH